MLLTINIICITLSFLLPDRFPESGNSASSPSALELATSQSMKYKSDFSDVQ